MEHSAVSGRQSELAVPGGGDMWFGSSVKFAVYNLRTYFSRQPGDIRCCPACGSSLSRSDIDPSRAVSEDLALRGAIAMRDFSHLYECTACEWWAVRESWSFYEAMQDMDYLIVSAEKGTVPRNAARRASPWKEVLKDEHVYDHASPLPDALGELFIGGKRT